MENQRLILFVALSVVILLLWQAWQGDFGEKKAVTPTVTAGQQAIPTDVPPSATGTAPPQGAGAPAMATATSVPADATALKKGERIRVYTDLLELEIDTLGGDLRKGDLLAYPVTPGKPEPFHLLTEERAKLFIAQSGLLADTVAPNHHALYSTAQHEYRLVEGVDELKVPLIWTSEQGITVTKTYTLHRGSYVVDVEYKVENNSAQAWKGHQYRQFQHAKVEKESAFIYTFNGGVVSGPENKYQKLSYEDMDKQDFSKDMKGGWAAMIQHYFVAAWIPGPEESNHFYSKALGEGMYVLGMTSSEQTIAPGAKGSFSSRFYVGPKVQDRLEAAAPHLELTVDYGWLTFIAKPLFWLLQQIHGIVHNWGWSIILLTLIIKLAFYKLSETSYRSMANMRRMAPKLTQLRERYGDDRQRMSQAMMELYKKEKINPLGGCLPILVQIPVFIALYWVLLESVELRQASFVLWLTDLSTKDPYYVLPLIMGVSMFVQQKLNPPPPDPIQAKVMMALPFIFTVFFAFFPSGLVLYWVVNNLLSITQQWYITRRVEKAAAQ